MAVPTSATTFPSEARSTSTPNPVLRELPIERNHLESGMSAYLGNGILNAVNTGFTLSIARSRRRTMNYNLSFQRQMTRRILRRPSATLKFFAPPGTYADPNAVRALYPAGTSTQQYQPFPDLGGIGTIHYGGVSIQLTAGESGKRASMAWVFSLYTWAHAMDTGSAGGRRPVGDRQRALIPLIMNSPTQSTTFAIASH